jgi:hypothetical protein
MGEVRQVGIMCSAIILAAIPAYVQANDNQPYEN